MTVSISSSPPYPAAGQSTVLVGTSDLYQGEDVEWELTSVPAESKLPLGPLLERAAKVPRTSSIPFTYNAGNAAKNIYPTITRPAGSFLAEGYEAGMTLVINSPLNKVRLEAIRVTAGEIRLPFDATIVTETAASALTAAFDGRGGPPTNLFVPDVPGVYGVDALEFFNYKKTHRLMSKASSTIHVGSHLSLPIEPVNGHGSTLRILVVGSTVRRAELVDPKTELARVAALDATVAAAVTALEGVAVGSVDVDFETDVNAIAAAYLGHIADATSHDSGVDTVNGLLRETANSKPSALARLNEIALRLQAHREATTAGGTWHAGGDDAKNTLQVAPTATTLAQGIVLKADLRERSFRRHIAQVAAPASHATEDTSNAPSLPVKPLPAAIRDYLDFIASATPTAASGEAEGVLDAQAAWGFRA